MTRVACGLFLAIVAGCAGHEWVRDYHGYVPGTEQATTCVFHVVDRRTGRPVPNVTVVQHPEWWIDENGDWAPAWARTKTDRYGLAWFVLDEDPGPCHWAIHADGYAPTEEFGGVGLQTTVELRRGAEHAGRILRYDGAPLAGALVEYKVGCAHAPALRTTRTNRDGVFVFRQVAEGDFPIEHALCRATYWRGPGLRSRAHGVPSCTMDPGLAITGRVVNPDGTPPDWCVLTTLERGSRAKVDARGRFVLHGASPNTTLLLWTRDDRFEVNAADYRPGGPLLLHLQEQQPPLGPTERVAVKLAGDPEEGVEVHLDRLEDGRRFSAHSVGALPGDVAEFNVPRGRYLVSAGAPSSRYRATDEELVVRGPTTVRLELDEQARLQLSTQPADEFVCQIVLEDRIWTISSDSLGYLPTDARAWFRVTLGQQAFTFPIGPATDGVRHARVRLPGLKRLEVGGDDAYLQEYDETTVYAGGTLETYAVGRRTLVVVDEERGRAICQVDLDFEGGTRRIDELVFAKPSENTLRVLDDRGRPFDAWVDVFPTATEFDSSQCDGEGFVRSASLRSGAVVRISPSVRPSDLVSRTTTLQGDGPYEVRLGSATIEVDVNGLEDAAVLLDGTDRRRAGDDGTIVLRGVTAGPHLLLVGARGRIGKAYRLFVREDEVRRLAPELERRMRR